MVFFLLLLFPPWMPTEIFAPGTATSSPRSRNTRQTPSTAWTVFGAWTVLAAVASTSTTTTTTTRTAEALRLGFGLPGGGRVSYRDGLLRIQPPAPKDTETETPSSNAKTFEVPWDQAVAINPESSRAASEIGVGVDIDIDIDIDIGVEIEIEIENRETASKGYGAFYVGSTPLGGGSFLGLYEGRLVTPREALDRLHARRRKELLDTGSEEDAKKVGDYVLSLDGGVHFLDGFDLRYKGSKNSDENNDENSSNSKQPFTPAHLNHADKGGPGCNVLRKLVYLPDDFCFDKPSDTDTSPGTGTESAGGTFRVGDYPRNLPRVAFFAAREISTGEELAFDYGANFWKT